MGRVIFFVCLIAQLLIWDLYFKVATLFSYRAARRHIDRHVAGMARKLFTIADLYAGLRFEITSTAQSRLPRQALVVANHQSLIDIPMLMVVLRRHTLRFVAKRELKHWFPAVSHVLRVQRHALIDRRSDFQTTMNQLRSLGRRAASGTSPVIFPEGTRSRSGKVAQFNAGAVRRVLEPCPLPIIAIALDGGYRFSRLNDLTKRMRNTTYRARIVAVYDTPTDKRAVASTLADANERIAEQVERWQAADRSPTSGARQSRPSDQAPQHGGDRQRERLRERERLSEHGRLREYESLHKVEKC